MATMGAGMFGAGFSDVGRICSAMATMAMPLPQPPPFMAIDAIAMEYVKQMAKEIPVDQVALQVQNLVCLTAREKFI
jgi:hypothetical protein